LDGWRGIAALAVAAFHFGVSNHFYWIFLIRTASPYVDFFFVLSGFVIAHTYADRLRTLTDIRSFIVRRFGRLWPLHIAVLSSLIALETLKWVVIASTGISAGEAAFTGSSSAMAIPAHLAFLQSFGIFQDYTWNGPSWSIGCEFWTYLVFAVVCLTRARPRLCIMCGLMIVSAAILARFNDGGLPATYNLGFFRCVLGFFAGALTHQLYRLRSTRRDVVHAKHATAAELGVVAVAILFIGVAPDLVQMSPLLSFVPVLLFPAIVVIFAAQRGVLSRCLLSIPIQRLGTWSYSIYMIHFVVITVLNSSLRVLQYLLHAPLPTHDVGSAGPTFALPLWLGDAIFLSYLAVVIAASGMTWRFVEEPCRIFFNRLARQSESSGGERAVPSLQGHT
jgi:hypothetical protein